MPTPSSVSREGTFLSPRQATNTNDWGSVLSLTCHIAEGKPALSTTWQSHGPTRAGATPDHGSGVSPQRRRCWVWSITGFGPMLV